MEHSESECERLYRCPVHFAALVKPQQRPQQEILQAEYVSVFLGCPVRFTVKPEVVRLAAESRQVNPTKAVEHQKAMNTWRTNKSSNKDGLAMHCIC